MTPSHIIFIIMISVILIIEGIHKGMLLPKFTARRKIPIMRHKKIKNSSVEIAPDIIGTQVIEYGVFCFGLLLFLGLIIFIVYLLYRYYCQPNRPAEEIVMEHNVAQEAVYHGVRRERDRERHF